MVIWITGRSGTGKTTIGRELSKRLGWKLLDGDELRAGINSDLGYDRASKKESALRTAYVTRLFDNCVVSHMSPYAEDREKARRIASKYFEVYLTCPIETLKSRDTKGFYESGNAFIHHEQGTPNMIFDTSIDSVDNICKAIIQVSVEV